MSGFEIDDQHVKYSKRRTHAGRRWTEIIKFRFTILFRRDATGDARRRCLFETLKINWSVNARASDQLSHFLLPAD